MTLIEPPTETTAIPPRPGLTAPAGAKVAGSPMPASIVNAATPRPKHSFSRWRQLAILAVAAALVVLSLAIAPKLVEPNVEQSSEATNSVPGTFRPTAAQLAGFEIEPVRLVSFRPQQVTEGNIALD